MADKRKVNKLDFPTKAKKEHSKFLRTRPNVIGLGVGKRVRGGEVVDEIVVKVYVSKKLPQARAFILTPIPEVFYERMI